MATPQTVLDERRRRLNRTSTRLPEDFRIEDRPFSPELQQAVRDLTRSVRTAPVTERDIMESPSFQAQRQAIDFARREREAGTRRDLASRGILRSTPSVQALEAEGARADAAIAAVVPQLLEAARAREQQNIANLLNLVQTRAGLEESTFQRGLSEFGALAPFRFETPSQRLANAATEASLTGRFLPPDVSDLFQQVIDLKQQAATNPADIPALNQAANEIRAQIQAMGFDPSIVGADVTLDQAVRNIRQAGTLTPQQRQLEAGLTGIDPITGQPIFAARESAAERAAAAARAREARQFRTPEQQVQDRAAQRYLSGTATEEDLRILGIAPEGLTPAQRTNALLDVWRATGVAPEGLEEIGVQPGTVLPDQAGGISDARTNEELAVFMSLDNKQREKILENRDLMEQLAQDGVDVVKLWEAHAALKARR